MSLFPVIVIFGLSFPPIFFELLLSLAIFWLVHRLLVPTGIYDLSGTQHCLIRRSIAAFFI
ncbi:efflux system membrane protein [Klebsiella pneumoniae]|uniref:Efflux system membrane protein n=1 Tax=Klebsiella pneumoniae TaxID=573 RepID=A0A377U173_KLEPN|nr:efflux system membrane protein [Klebsiella pneumoniae]